MAQLLRNEDVPVSTGNESCVFAKATPTTVEKCGWSVELHAQLGVCCCGSAHMSLFFGLFVIESKTTS